MNRKLLTNAEQYVKKTRGRRRWQWFVRFVASIVVFCTTYALILPAITMEQKAYCGLEEHVHDDSCYIQILDSQETGEATHVHTAACLDASGAEICGFHVHSDSCYTKERGDLLCQRAEQEGHAHTELCYGDEPVMVCQREETAGHTHGEGCYTEQPMLSCQLPVAEAHTHGDGCFDAEGALICQQAESDGHTHGETCYTEQQVLTCQLPVAEAHTHGDGCWEYPLICGQTVAEGHTHNDDCYQWSTTLTCDLPLAPAETTPSQPELTCQDPTHDHTARCYGTWELCCGMEEHSHDLRCFSDPDADVETREVWERTFADVELTGVWAEDVLAIAKSQLGYQESTRNYDVWEDGTTHGYTRYGHWYGSPYGDWCAMFASFCIAYAGVDEEAMPLNWGCRTWIADLSQPELDLYRPAADYTPKPGDLIFFDWEDAEGNSDDLSDHVGIVAELIPQTEETPARIKTIEGNSSNQVKYNTYDQADTQILGYGVIPENPANLEPTETEPSQETGPAFTYSDEELYVEVRLPADTTVPADAVLWVTPIDTENADYAAYLARSEEAVEGTVAGIALYDISFYTPDGEYLPVSDRAEVIMGFTKSPVEGEGELQVLHFAQEDTPPQVIDQVTVGEQELEMRLGTDVQDQPALMTLEPPEEPTEETQPATETEPVPGTEPAEETITEVRTVLQFQTDGFSTFAVVQVDFTQEYGTWIVDLQADALGGQTFLISTTTPILNKKTSELSHRALTSEIVSFEPNDNKQVDNMHLAAASVSNDGTIVTAKTSALETYLWEFTQVQGNTYHIQSKANGEYLYIGDGLNAHTSATPIVITVTKGDGYFELSEGERKLAYDDDAATANNETVFTSYLKPEARGQFVLSTQLIATKALDVNAELDGVTAVISIRDAWQGNYYAVSSEATGDIGEFTAPRKAVQVTRNSTNDTVYIAPGDADKLLWTFHKVANTADMYTIQHGNQYLVQNGTSLGIGDNPTQFQRVVGEGNGDLVLKAGNRYLSFATDGGFVTFGTPNDADHNYYQRADLLISQYGPTITETPDENVVPVTDLDNRFYMIVAVDNGESGNPVALTNGTAKGNAESKLQQAIDGKPYDVLDGQYVANFEFTGQNFNNYYNLTWFFESDSDNPGRYFIRAYNGQNWNGYLTAEGLDSTGVTDLTIGEEGQSFQVLQATNTGTASAVVLRWGDSQVYVNLYGNASYNEEDGIGEGERNNFFVGYRAGDNAASGQNERGNHVVLAGFQNVNTVLNAAEYLLDSLDVQGGKYQFSDDAYIGSASPGNANVDGNNGSQGTYGASHAPDFVAGYEAAKAYRREMQQLARQLREAVAGNSFTYDGKTVTLTPMEIAYVKATIGEIAQQHGIRNATYENVLGDGGQLKWLWDVVGVVQPNNPTGVKVNLFNYDESVNNTGLAYGRENDYNNPKGFTFYHKVQYDEYTQVDTGRDEKRGNGVLGSDNSELYMSPTLGEDGYPVVTGGAGSEFNSENGGSLAYLFSPINGYHEATMDDGGGLFRRDSEGYYYYNANENAAWYNEATNQFVLYDTVIRPMYIHGADPGALNDVYNFLPFNNPYDDLIFDVPYTIKDNNTLTGYTSNHLANTERSGYLNERADMWFGMTIEFSFLMANNGMVYTPTGGQVPMVFDFYGDDDVWVYIDDRLVLDLGGVKGAEKGSINFATGAVSYQDGSRGTINETLADIFQDTGAQLNGNTFTDGVAHTLKFFYMERGGNVSYCGLRFNMPLLPENFLMVTKSRENETENGTKPIGNPYHTFRVVEANEAGKPVDANGQETAKLAEMVPYFKANTPFDICHENTTTPVVDTGIVDANGYFTIPVGYSAVFNDVLNLRKDNTKVYYAIVEVLYDVEKDQYNALKYTLNTVQNRAELSSPDFSQEGVYLYARPVGSFAYTAGIDANQSSTLNLSNVVKNSLGKLAVTKQLAAGVGSGHENEEFTVRVEFGGYAIVEKNGATTSELVYTPAPRGTAYTLAYKGEDGTETTESKTIDNDDGTIQLKPGQTATFDGIVAGTRYRITEVLDTGDNWIPTYSGTVTDQESTESTDGNFTGEIGLGQSPSVTITNQNFTVSVELPLRKKVEYAAMTDTFTFNVQWIQDAYTLDAANAAAKGYYNLPGTSITVTPEEATAGKTGKVIIGFSDESINAMEKDPGMAYYKISEQPGNGGYLYDKTYYIVEVKITKASGETPATAKITGIWKNGTEKVYPTETSETVPDLEFTNHRTTSVTVEKEVTTGSTVDTFQYTYTVKYPDGTECGEGSFSLKHNGKHTITDIPIGAIVEVTEAERGDYAASYNVTAVYEAEYGEISGGAAVSYDGNPSAGAYVGFIKGSTDTVTLPVYTNAAIGADFIFRYAQQANRSFTVGGTDYSMPSTGGWQTWQEDTQARSGPTLAAGENRLTIGGYPDDAPNLDSLKVIFGRVAGNTAAVNVLGDGSVIHFVNEPRTSVTVTKKVEGSDKTETFTFQYTLTDPDAQAPIATGTFDLVAGQSQTITGIPLGALLTLTETNSGTANTTRMQMTTRLEAEDGGIQGAVSINAAEAASGGRWAGNISGDNSLTFQDLKVHGSDSPDLNLRYMQDDTRSFVVSIHDTTHTVQGESCNTWEDWSKGKTATISGVLPAGTSTMTIRGPEGNFAPNLDYVDLVWPEATTVLGGGPENKPTLTQYINGETTIVVVNQTGYQLPMTGGTGTQLYTIGGLLLMAAAILLYYQIRRRRGDYASP